MLLKFTGFLFWQRNFPSHCFPSYACGVIPEQARHQIQNPFFLRISTPVFLSFYWLSSCVASLIILWGLRVIPKCPLNTQPSLTSQSSISTFCTRGLFLPHRCAVYEVVHLDLPVRIGALFDEGSTVIHLLFSSFIFPFLIHKRYLVKHLLVPFGIQRRKTLSNIGHQELNSSSAIYILKSLDSQLLETCGEPVRPSG